jgi:hydrogenase maturation protease
MNKNLIIALGNDILGDDGVAIEAANVLKKYLPVDTDIEEVFGGGFELLDLLEGREKALIIDSVSTGYEPPGTIFQLTSNDFMGNLFVSPHYIGLPEVLSTAKLLSIPLPDDIKILAMEISPEIKIIKELSPPILEKLPLFIEKAKAIIEKW